MSTGAYISGVGHLLVILAVLIGGLFTRSRMPDTVSVSDVSTISEAEFAALTAPQTAPDVTSDAVEPEAPVIEDAPELAALPDAAPEVPQIEQPSEPQESDAPADPLPPLEQPDAEVSDVLPPQEAPPVPDDRPDAPEEATPAPAPRVAPQVAPPVPDAEQAPDVVENTTPTPAPEQPQPEEAAQAPEEATTEIVTEAETPTLAPSAAPRPRSRPERRVAAEAPEEPREEPQPEAESTADAIADAVAAAVAEQPAETPRAPSGPPLSFGEKEALRVAVSQCWDVDVGGRSADVTVIVAVDMNPDGTVAGGQVRQVSATGGDSAAQRTAYEKARRAILRCQRGGFPLPAEKYASWQQIEMTFNPEGMRLR